MEITATPVNTQNARSAIGAERMRRVSTLVSANAMPADSASHSAKLAGSGKPSPDSITQAPASDRTITGAPANPTRSPSSRRAKPTVHSGAR